MQIHLTGDLSENLIQGIHILQEDLNFQLTEKGIHVQVNKRVGVLEAGCDGEQGFIHYENPIHFYRALGLFIENSINCKRFHVTEKPQFINSGAMFDVSRNGVLKVDSIKKFIRIMAVMGLNTFMLYTEDTFTLSNQPYFGYMRGKYTVAELKECDDYADMFGIEVIPCIQTLGHLTQALKWDYAKQIKDTDDILLVGEPATYVFIEEMIASITEPFRSKRIHIGMDEAHQLGLGKYLDHHGYKKRFDLMNEHLRQVLAITSKYDLHPMIWSDMYFRLGSKSGQYYDPNVFIPQDVIDDMPSDVQFVYWDYYHEEESFYQDYIRRHKSFGSDPVFAGGIWTWTGIVPNYGKTFRTTNAGLMACKQEGIKEAFVTMWGDNGSEGNPFSGLLGLQLYAEHTYAAEVTEEKLKSRFQICTGGDYESFMNVKYLDETPGTTLDNLNEANPSRYLLWQDVLLGLFDSHVEQHDLVNHYAHWEKEIQGYSQKSGKWSFLFDVYEKLSKVLRMKCDLGVRIKSSFDRQDKDQLRFIADQEIEELINSISELRDAHREQWFITNKAFGWEVIDIRYGGLLARMDTAAKRIKNYVDGRIDELEEMQESRLAFEAFYGWEDGALGHCNLHHRMVSPSAFS
ncbi:beta-N-acetylhexosaminidase [Paenibacillus glacialis]|uniref:Glycoside hydrolase n=1 Tax=Paenibacillus glacialis TaxID=494026 RepID=A0A168J2P3_9BACL|nr:beta-N-acetylhexosaminidase [Paenibacillus glacialis]OAB40082.1 glycoside hydrolase [Paenibacillus glacialis]